MTVPPVSPPPGEPPRPPGGEPFAISTYGDYYGQRSYQPPASKTMAGWALGLSIFNCFGVGALVAIGLAIAVLVKGQRDGRNHGKGMAIAALIISALWLLAFVVIVVLTVTGRLEVDDSERDPGGELSREQTVSLSSLRDGDCLGDGEFERMVADDGVYEVTAVPCSDQHGVEIFAVFELADGSYPGDDEVIRLAETECIDRFREFVGVPFNRSRLKMSYTFPQSVTWRIADDREVMCYVGEPAGRTTGTLENARR